MDSERLARVEEKLDGLIFWLERSSDNQAEKNKAFFDTRDRVTILEATARGAWKVLATIGTISAAFGAGFAWFVEHPNVLSFSLLPVTSTLQKEPTPSEKGNYSPYYSVPDRSHIPSQKKH